MYQISEKDKEGQPHSATIFLEKDELYGDVNTMRQIREMITDPSVQNARIMPDCHFGNSCCIGFTSKLTRCTVPRYIGGDIGCGMATYRLDPNLAKKLSKNLERYHDAMVLAIPLGNDKHILPITTDLGPVTEQAHKIAISYHKATKAIIPPPSYDSEWIKELYKRINIDEAKVLSQLGTLGGGNHFIEVGEVIEPGEWQGSYLSVHTGSRALGQAICSYHQDIITQSNQRDHEGYRMELQQRMRADKGLKQPKRRQELETELKKKYLDPKHERYLEGEEAERYFYDMIFAQQYARYNRYLIIDQILLSWNAVAPDPTRIIESVHNYIDFEDHVWRKGAIRADRGQTIIIALNMRDGILLAQGKGNPEWNCSAPHGAGRRVPRNQAQQHVNLKQFQKQMQDVFSKSICKETIDESPDMYKNPDLVRMRSQDTCDVIAHIRPVINIKATS